MRIISKDRDYYDSAQSFGSRADLCFVRKSETVAVRHSGASGCDDRLALFEGMPDPCNTSTKGGQVHLMPFRIVFCGKTYHGVEVLVWSNAVSRELLNEFHYEGAALARLLEKLGLREDVQSRSLVSGKVFGERHEEFLNEPSNASPDAFIISREAIVLARVSEHGHRTVMLNPILKTLQFAKVLHAWQVYQELEMFFGSIAAPENSLAIEIPDKYRIASHGYDKYSFRKAPTKKR